MQIPTMVRQLLILLMLVLSYGCNKGNSGKNEGYLMIRIDGDESYVPWETFTSSWQPNTSTLKMEGIGHQFKFCTVDLKNIGSASHINITSLDQLYYGEGVQFIPDSVSGVCIISKISSDQIEGTLHADLFNRQNNKQIKLKGEFGSFIGE